jgi:hypothetical protein
MTRDEATRRLHRRHVEKKSWPVTRNDPKAGPDGYIHYCAADHEPWPCLVHVALTTTDHPDVRAGLERERALVEALQALMDTSPTLFQPEIWDDCLAALAASRAALSATSEPKEVSP